jgi:hypothetical protein
MNKELDTSHCPVTDWRHCGMVVMMTEIRMAAARSLSPPEGAVE